MRKCAAVLLAIVALRASAQDYLAEGFDTFLAGPIHTQQGWGGTNLERGAMATIHYTRLSLSASSNGTVRVITP